jgi:uncharacterized protein YpuA (DUF1002 family)
MIASAKGTDHQISEEERMVRNHEMELLARISAPPKKNDNALEELVKSRKEGMFQNDSTDKEEKK